MVGLGKSPIALRASSLSIARKVLLALLHFDGRHSAVDRPWLQITVRNGTQAQHRALTNINARRY